MTETIKDPQQNQTHKWTSTQKLTWNTNSLLYKKREINQKFPKYFGKQNFSFNILQSNPTFAKMKRLKTIQRLTVVPYGGFFHKKGFHKKQLKALCKFHSKKIRKYEKGEPYIIGSNANYKREPTPYFRSSFPHLESYYLDHLNPLAVKSVSRFRQLRFLLIQYNSVKETYRKLFEPHQRDRFAKMLLKVSNLPHLKIIKVDFEFGICNNEWIFQVLELFDQSVQNWRQDLTFTLNLGCTRSDLARFNLKSEPSLFILSRITHFKVSVCLQFFLRRLREFENLTHLEITASHNNAVEVGFQAENLFFTELKKLKNLKSLSLAIFLQYGRTKENDLQALLNNFYIPETIEKLSLSFEWTPWHLLLSYPQKENVTDLLETNPILESPEFKEFLSVFTRLEKLRSFRFRFEKIWELGYALNRYLGFAILSKIPKLEKLKYDCKNSTVQKTELPPMDLFMFFESIQHHLPSLTTLVITDTSTTLKQSLDSLAIQMPNLKTFYINCLLVGNEAACEVPRLIRGNGMSQLRVKFSRINIQDESIFVKLFESLRNGLANTKIFIGMEISSISTKILEKQVLTFFNEMKGVGSVFLDLIVDKHSLKLFEKSRKTLEKSLNSFKLRLEENRFEKTFSYKTQTFSDFSQDFARLEHFSFLEETMN